jgi:tetraprenyl-beta-curcumene synthase
MHEEALDPCLTARSLVALTQMSVRYWTTVIARTTRQLQRWRKQAQTISDHQLRALATTKLTEEQSNVYFATTFATLAPREWRATTIEAIVAVQIIYDYLDGITEQPTTDRISDGLQLFRALSDTARPPGQRCDYYSHHQRSEDCGYLARLVATASSGLAKLPARTAVADIAISAATRCAGAQVRSHAAHDLGIGQLEHWAREQTHKDASWREAVAASASAVISIHALIAAAADPDTTSEQAIRIAEFHNHSTCVLATILDGFADFDRDEHANDGQIRYLHYFPDKDLLGERLTTIVRSAIKQAPLTRHGGHHLMTLAGVISYYLSALNQQNDASRKIVTPLQHELSPLITPTLAFMRAWRLGKHLYDRRTEDGAEALV